ncbi:MAG: sigma-70 family RNA polymerase sigma factor [Microscillaceae bacterium]|jgi:RNA polymerase sigma-70 factor (ECF subfamily)|nr:sigma-70 family RNA polymerase sigma factor [Microscillaceae bacterium]
MSKKAKFSDTPEPLIWQAFKTGDEEAFNYIFNQYARFLFNYGDKIAQNEGLVEDCIQELFIELWEKKAKLGEVQSIKYYLLKSLQRKILRKLNKNRKMLTNEDSDLLFNDDLIDFPYENHLIQSQTNLEQQEKLQKALALLSDRQRQVLFLKYYDQLDYEEIARVMSMNVKAIYDLIYQAIKSLKKIFNKGLLFIFYTIFSFFN